VPQRDVEGHWREHPDGTTEEEKAGRLWASGGNDTSFVFACPSLVNALQHRGFSSIHECFTPPHLNFGAPGLEHEDRCTFVSRANATIC